MKILIVEDEAVTALDLELLVGQFGHDIAGTAATRAEALALVGRDPPDVALVDINLRDGATGPQIAEELARRFGTAIVFVTANRDLTPEFQRLARAVLHKPIRESDLGAVLAATAGESVRQLRAAS